MSSGQQNIERPPEYNGDLPAWAEDLIDYLLRLNADKQRQLNDLEARVEALEP